MKVVIALVAAWIGCAPQSFDMSGMLYRPTMMLARPDVKKELHLSKEQNKQADAIQRDLQKSSQNIGNDINKGFAALKAMEEADGKLITLLDDTQKVRLREIILQAKGVNALRDEDVRKELVLSDDQVAKLDAAHNEASNAYFEKARARYDKKAIETIAKKYEETALALLSVDQAAKFKAMQGKPFKNARPPGMPPF